MTKLSMENYNFPNLMIFW